MAARALGLALLVGVGALLTGASLDAGQSNVVLRTSLSDDIPTLIVMYGPDGVRVHLQGGLVPIDGTAQPRSPAVSQVWLLRTNGSAVKQRSAKESSYILAWAGTKGVIQDYLFDDVPRDQLAGVVLEIGDSLVVRDLRWTQPRLLP